MFYAGDWWDYLEINRPSWNKGFRGSHDIILITFLAVKLKRLFKSILGPILGHENSTRLTEYRDLPNFNYLYSGHKERLYTQTWMSFSNRFRGEKKCCVAWTPIHLALFLQTDEKACMHNQETKMTWSSPWHCFKCTVLIRGMLFSRASLAAKPYTALPAW